MDHYRKTNHRRLQTNEGMDIIKEKRDNNTDMEGWTSIEILITGACRLMKELTVLQRKGGTLLIGRMDHYRSTNHRRLQTNEGTDCIKEKRRNTTDRNDGPL